MNSITLTDERSNSLELALGIAGAVVPVLIMALCFVCYRKRRHNSLHSSAHNSDFTASTGIYTETHLPEPLRQLFQRLPSQGSGKFVILIFSSFFQRKCKRIKVAEATCSQILAYQLSVFPGYVDQLPKFGPTGVMVIRLYTAILNSL